jgi:hypothetical protein
MNNLSNFRRKQMRNSRNLVLLENVNNVHVGRALADIKSRLSIVVPASGQSSITVPGGKCIHGVYIAATSPWPNHAEYCSICRPYEILVRKGGIYKA